MAIYFYTTTDQYGFLSNFSRHGFELEGYYWPTVEHYFQSQKFFDSKYQERIRLAKNPKEAANLGRSRLVKLRSDWESAKDEVMYRAIQRKFLTHQDLREKLLNTGDEPLIENSPIDYYWGCGKDGTGRNMSGVILMRVRGELRR